MNLRDQANNVAGAGRYGDTMLMHVNPAEVEALSQHVPLTRNPDTGHPEAFLPMLLGMGLPALAGAGTLGATMAGMSPALLAGIGSGLGTLIQTGDPGAALASGVTGGMSSAAMGYMMGGAPGAAGGAAPTGAGPLSAPAPLMKPNVPPGLDPAYAANFVPDAPIANMAQSGPQLPFDVASLNLPPNVSPHELRALAMTESTMNPAAVSPAGAQGLTQIMPETAKAPGYGVNPISPQDVWDPAKNAQFGAEYLGAMKNEFGDMPTALAAYNRGPGNVQSMLAEGHSFANDPYVSRFNQFMPQPGMSSPVVPPAPPPGSQGMTSPPGAGLSSPMVPGPQGSPFAPKTMDIMPMEKPSGGIMDTLADNWLPITAGVAGLGMLMGPEEEESKRKGSKPKRYQSSRTYTPMAADPYGRENPYFSPMTFKPVGFKEGGGVLGGLMNLGGGAMGGLIPAMVNRDLPLNPIDYFMNFHNKKDEEEEKRGFPGGLKQIAGYQQGGPVQDEIVQGAMMAIQGSHPDPESAIRRFVQAYGMDALEELVAQVDELSQQGDTVPAMLEPGEFVMSKDAVDGVGGGNNAAGAAQLEGLMKLAEAA